MDDILTHSFKLVAETKLNDYIPIKKYRSSKTGLSVIFLDIEGPNVSGHFIVVTEPTNDDGLPHALEKLITYGSEDYPYKGVFDLIEKHSCRINSWIGDDYVFYSVECIGAEAFHNFLPIYMDHILYPLLPDTAFMIEVHHITEKGEDGGVIYDIMKQKENTEEDRLNTELMKNLYPGTGYAYHSGGLSKKLRESVTNNKIKEFHSKFYHAENLTLVIAGQINPDDIFHVLNPIEQKILDKGNNQVFKRYWQQPVEPLLESKLMNITYPDDEEKIGLTAIAYRGPSTKSEQVLVKACDVILGYLTEYPHSPLMSEMEEVNDPFTSFIYPFSTMNQDSLRLLYFRNAPLQNIDKIYDKYFSILNKVGDGREPINMKRLKTIIENRIIGNCFDLEVFPHAFSLSDIIRHVVYGDDDNFDEWLNSNRIFNNLLNKDKEYWIEILNKYFIDAPHVYVKAMPSIEEKERLENEDLTRFEQRRTNYGSEKLLELRNKLKEAIAANNVPPPESIFSKLSSARYTNIGSYSVKIYGISDDPESKITAFDELPVHKKIIQINSNCVYALLSINTEHIAEEHRFYLPLFLELLENCAVSDKDKISSNDEYMSQFRINTLFMTENIGMHEYGAFSSYLFIDLRIGLQRVHLVPKYLNDFLNNLIFDIDCIKSCTTRILNQTMDSTSSNALELAKTMLYKSTSNICVCSDLKQKKFLQNLLAQLENPTDCQDVINDLNTLRQMLMQNNNIGLYIATNWEKIAATNIETISNEFKKLFEGERVTEHRVVSDYDLIENDEPSCLIYASENAESPILHSAIKSLKNYFDPDIPALMLLCHYFTQDGGMLHQDLIEQGHVDNYAIELFLENGILKLNLNSRKNLITSYKTAKSTIENHLKEDFIWDSKLIESSKVSLVHNLLEHEESLAKAVKLIILSSFRNVTPNYNRTLIEKITKVSQEDLLNVGLKHMKVLFGTQAHVAIVCHPNEIKEIQNNFEEFGYMCKQITTLDDLN